MGSHQSEVVYDDTNVQKHPDRHHPIMKLGVSNLYFDEATANAAKSSSIPGSNRAHGGGYFFKPHMESLLTTKNIVEAEASLRYVVPSSNKKKRIFFVMKPSKNQLQPPEPKSQAVDSVDERKDHDRPLVDEDEIDSDMANL